MSNYKLGPCQILYGGVDLGKTEGGINVTLSHTFQMLHTDQDGESPVDEYITGTDVKVTANLAANTLSNIATIMHSTLEGSGTKRKVEITPNVGTSLLANGGILILKPYINGVVTSQANNWITLHKAGIKAQADLAFNRNDQRVIKFEAVGYPDSTTSLIATFGDSSF